MSPLPAAALSVWLAACSPVNRGDGADDTAPTTATTGDTDTDTTVPTDPPGIDLDGDGWTARTGDCDETRPEVHPGAVEQCDERDWDCDGLPLAPGICGEEVGVDVVGVHLTTAGRSAAVWPIGDPTGDGRPDFLAHEYDLGPPAPDGTRGPAWLLGAGPDGTVLDYPDGMYASFSQPLDDVEAETRGSYGDVDGDGIADVGIAMEWPNAIYLHAGPVAPGGRWVTDTPTWWSSPRRDAKAPWGFPIVSGGDLDGDGRSDAVVGVPSNEGPFAADVFLGGTFGDDSAVARIWSTEWTGGDGALLDDLDGDGLAEIYLGDKVHHVIRGADLPTADGATLDDLTLIRFTNGDDAQWSSYTWDALTPGDWTGDGLADLVLGQPHAGVAVEDGGVILVFDGTSRGEQAPTDAAGSWVSAVAGARTSPIATLDFDGDGGPDVVASCEADWVLLPHARGMPGPYTPIEGLRYQGDDSALVSHPGADFDGDGDDELLYNEYRQVLYVGYLEGWPVPWDEPGWW